jgi:hypothetical protein
MALPMQLQNPRQSQQQAPWNMNQFNQQQVPYDNSWSNFFWGQGPQNMQFGYYNPEQQQMFQQMLQSGQNMWQNPYEGFEPIRQNALNTFNQQVVPGLAERFGAMTGGAMSSPAFASQLGAAGQQLSQGLAGMESQYGQQNRQQALQAMQMGGSRQFENMFMPRQPGLVESSIPGALQAAGKIGGAALGATMI